MSAVIGGIGCVEPAHIVSIGEVCENGHDIEAAVSCGHVGPIDNALAGCNVSTCESYCSDEELFEDLWERGA